MGRPRGRANTVVTLPIGDGDTITIQPTLSVRDADQISEQTKRSEQVIMLAACVIESWSLRDYADQPIPWPDTIEARRETLYDLDLDTYEAIARAIDGYYASRPKARPDGPASDPISPSAG